MTARIDLEFTVKGNVVIIRFSAVRYYRTGSVGAVV